jgi:dTDP-4-dehydrorhamnose reductase
VFKLTGNDDARVTGVSTEEYYAEKKGVAPRPLKSTLDLTKISYTGFKTLDWTFSLHKYLK